MDAYCYALSTIKKLGYICDTLLYLTDFQSQLFLRRLSNCKQITTNKSIKKEGVRTLFFIFLLPRLYANDYREW